MLSKRETGLNDLGHSQPMQIVKGATMKRFTVKKVCSGEKAEDAAGELFASAEEIMCVTRRSPQPSQQTSGRDMRLPAEDLCRSLLSNGVNLCDMQGDSQVSRTVHQQECRPGQRDSERTK